VSQLQSSRFVRFFGGLERLLFQQLVEAWRPQPPMALVAIAA
jgi:hypothetical protein